MPLYEIEIFNYKTTFNLFSGDLAKISFVPKIDGPEGFIFPQGYSTPVQSVFLKVKDAMEIPIYGLKVFVTDGNLDFVQRTNYDGLAYFPLPAKQGVDTQKWKVYIEGGKRYHSYSDTIEISTSNYGQDLFIKEVVLKSKIKNTPKV